MHLPFAAALPMLLAASDGIPENVLPVILGGMLIGALGIGIAVAAIVTDARTERSRHETIRIALEKGMPIPPDLISPRDRVKPPRDDRRTGIILIAVSTGIFVFLSMIDLGKLAYVAAIPGCIGIAFLLTAVLEKKTRGPASIGDTRL